MGKVLVVYDSDSGSTEQMARAVVEGAGPGARLVKSCDVGREDFFSAEALVLGSPCHYGSMSAGMKAALEQLTPDDLGKLEGKAGGAFATSLFTGGGNELTVLSLIHYLLAQGMVVQGVPLNDHFGPVSVGSPSSAVLESCRAYGARIASLATCLASG